MNDDDDEIRSPIGAGSYPSRTEPLVTPLNRTLGYTATRTSEGKDSIIADDNPRINRPILFKRKVSAPIT